MSGAGEAARPLPQGPVGWIFRIAVAAGTCALLAAMSVEVLAVIGRHTGRPLVGSIEIVRACVVLATSSAIVAATALKAHASVHLLTERLSETSRARLARLGDLVSAVIFAVFAAGSIWIAAEIWPGDERTQLLGLPIAPLRAYWCAAAALTAALFLASALGRRR